MSSVSSDNGDFVNFMLFILVDRCGSSKSSPTFSVLWLMWQHPSLAKRLFFLLSLLQHCKKNLVAKRLWRCHKIRDTSVTKKNSFFVEICRKCVSVIRQKWLHSKTPCFLVVLTIFVTILNRYIYYWLLLYLLSIFTLWQTSNLLNLVYFDFFVIQNMTFV